MKKAVKKIWNAIMFLMGSDSDTRRGAVDNGLCDFSGQGKNKYGR